MKNLSIRKQKLLKQSYLYFRLLFIALLILGMLMLFTDLKSVAYALVTNVIVFIFLKKNFFKWKITLLILVSIAFKTVVYFCFEMELLIYILASFLFFPLLFLKDFFTKYDDKFFEANSEVFYMDSEIIKCIHTTFPNKQYASDPFSYIKTLNIKDVKSISFDKKMIEIAYKDTIFQPLELNKEDIAQIYEYVKSNFPKLLNNPAVIPNRKNENKFFIRLMLICLLIVLCFVGIYTLGENGVNKPMTNIFSILIGGLGFWVLWEIAGKR